MDKIPEKNTSDTKTKLVSVISSEYVSKLKGVASKSSKKSKSESNPATLDEKITFADVTVWFYKKNCPQCLDEARIIWDSLPETIIQKQNVNLFFDAYANQVLEKHEKFIGYVSKCKKIEKMILRTKEFIRGINEAIAEHSKTEITESQLPSLDELSFDIILKSVEGYDLDSVFQRKDLLGHQLEFGYKENKVASSIIMTNGNSLLFEQEKLKMKFSPKSGSIYINLYEKYGKEDEITESKCVAMRNLDLFTNVNEWYIREVFNNSFGGGSDDSEETISIKKNASKVSKLQSARVFETFFLKKKTKGERKLGIEKSSKLSEDNLVKVIMSIELPAIRTVRDFQAYSKICEERVLCLKEQLQRARLQASTFKRKVVLLVAPFESVKIGEKTIEFEEIVRKASKHACNIF